MLTLSTDTGARSTPLSYRGDIDGLRAIAVLLILFYHLQIPGFSGGFVGVDIFFVISGFLITSLVLPTTESGNFSFQRFITGRAFRLIPSLLVVLLCAGVGAAATLSVTDMQAFGTSLIASLLFAGNFYFAQHSGYFDADSSSRPLLHLWSLGVEAQFYILWPLILLVVAKYQSRNHLFLLIAALAVASLASLLLLAPGHPNAAFYLLPSRFFEFMLGAAVALLPRMGNAYQDRKASDSCMLAGALLLIVAIASGHKAFGYHTLGVCLGAALLLYGAMHSRGYLVLNNPLTRYIGRISYELYLFHWPVITLYAYVAVGPLTLPEQTTLAIITLLLAVPTYHLVGKPFRYAWRQQPMRPRLPVTLLAITVGLAGLATSMFATHGWAWRLPADHRLFIDDPEKFHGTKFGGIGYQENTVLILGDASATPSLILIGDSHAGQYAAAFDVFLKENGKSAYLYYVNACLLMPGGSAHMYAQQTKECLGAPAALEALLSAHPLPVLQAQSWESYQNGTRFTSADGVRMPFMQAGAGEYYDTILTTITQMKSYLGDRRYMVLGIAPGIEDQQPIARCLAGPRLFTQACEKSATAPEGSRLTGQAFNQKFAQYVAANPTITFLNPRAALCHDGYCYALDEGHVLYSDRSHLTKDGAQKVLSYYQGIITAE